MRIESALYAGRSGLEAQGSAIAVVGDNISNANTVGFKSSRIEFADLLSEGAGGASSTTGGAAGSGVQVNRVRQIHETGVIEPTERALDVAIEGKGFFIVGDPTNPSYTRAGNFVIGDDGLLKDANGKNVLGKKVGATALGSLNMLKLDNLATPTTAAALAGNLNATDPIATVPTTVSTVKDLNSSFIANPTVYDSLGKAHDLTVAFYKTGASEWTARAYVDGSALTGGKAGQLTSIGSETKLTFTGNGVIADANKATAKLTATPAWSGGAAQGNFTLDLSSLSQFAATSQLATITQNGSTSGNIKDYQFKSDGTVLAVLDNSNTVQIGTLQLRDFQNVDALQRTGNANFIRSNGDGALDPANPGVGLLGTLRGNALERSTVDIASEFTNLILYQRGYQAASQTLSTASSLIRDTLGLIR